MTRLVRPAAINRSTSASRAVSGRNRPGASGSRRRRPTRWRGRPPRRSPGALRWRHRSPLSAGLVSQVATRAGGEHAGTGGLVRGIRLRARDAPPRAAEPEHRPRAHRRAAPHLQIVARRRADRGHRARRPRRRGRRPPHVPPRRRRRRGRSRPAPPASAAGCEAHGPRRRPRGWRRARGDVALKQSQERQAGLRPPAVLAGLPVRLSRLSRFAPQAVPAPPSDRMPRRSPAAPVVGRRGWPRARTCASASFHWPRRYIDSARRSRH